VFSVWKSSARRRVEGVASRASGATQTPSPRPREHCRADAGRHQKPTQANEDYFAKNGEPLFSSHMLDLSEDPLEENIATCVEYLERMSKSNLLLEMELGITGGLISASRGAAVPSLH